MTKLHQELAADFYTLYSQELISLILKEAKIPETPYTTWYVASFLLLCKDPKTDSEIKDISKCIKTILKYEFMGVTYG